MMQQAAKQRVLVVDDEPQVLVALEDLLSDKFTVFATESAQNALDMMLNDRDIAVVISDQRMPRMTGDQLLQRLARAHDALRILLTGFADLSAVIRAVNEGRIFAYVTKPWDPEDLGLKVEKAAEHFRLTRELAYERRLLRDLMDNTPDGIYVKDRELRFRRANRSLAGMLEQPSAQAFVGRRLSELVGDRFDATIVEQEEKNLLVKAAPVVDALRPYRREDALCWFSETKAPIKDPDGSVVGLVGILRDVTQQRQLEEQLMQSQKMEAIGRMAGGVAHDFNNLLVVIQSYGELLMLDMPQGDPRREDLAQMLLAGERAAALTRQLLAFSRRQTLQTKVLQLNDVVANVETMLRRVIGEDIELSSVLSPSLGTIRADPGQLEQIVINLSVNARDAMPEGGKLTIETTNVILDAKYAAAHPGVVAGEYVMLRVADTGVGMDTETLKRIFEPFFTTKEVGKGTGLGLSTVYGIVQQNQAHITVDSALGRGTCFEICFPRVDRPAAEAPSRRPSSLPPVGSGTILLVEDDEAVRHVAARILRNSGYHVLETRNPAEARQICTSGSALVDLLLTDIVMPEISGPKLAQELVLLCPQMRVLYMSGYSGTTLSDEETLGGEAAYVEKPFTPAGLVEKVRAVLEAT